MTKCEFSLIPCPKECKGEDNIMVTWLMRKYLEEHLTVCPCRDHQCGHCGLKGPHSYITSVHDKSCGKKKVPCPNANCTASIQQRNTKRHLERCDYLEVPCKYRKVGCGVKTIRKNMPSHEGEDKLHLHLALVQIASMKEQIADMKKRMNATKILKGGQAMTLKVTEFGKRQNHTRMFYTSSQGYKLSLQYGSTYLGSHFSMLVRVVTGKYDHQLRWPLVGTLSYVILNQVENDNHLEKMIHLDSSDSATCRDLTSQSELVRDPVKNTEYLNGGILYFQFQISVLDNVDKPWIKAD